MYLKKEEIRRGVWGAQDKHDIGEESWFRFFHLGGGEWGTRTVGHKKGRGTARVYTSGLMQRVGGSRKGLRLCYHNDRRCLED